MFVCNHCGKTYKREAFYKKHKCKNLKEKKDKIPSI